MKRYLLLAIVLFFFVLEGTVFQVFAPERYGATVDLIPRFVLVLIVIIGIFYGRVQGILYGIGFGLLYDVVYTELLGVYMFSLGFIGYVFSLSYRPVQRSYFLTILICIAAVISLEYFLYGFFYLFKFTDITATQFLFQRLLSTVGINLIFALLILYPLRKLILYFKKKEDPMSTD